jgi:hypothetical protein
MEEIESTYSTCPKCGVEHSNLVKHRCFKQDKAPPPPESEGGEGGEDRDDSEGGGGGKPQEGDGDGAGGGQGEGEDEGDGEGDGEEREAPVPREPEPEAPPVAVVVTVLKFAALTADCAKNGSIEVTLNRDGLFVYGSNGDEVVVATIPWTEFEKRSTIDGEFYVKGVIDEVDRALSDKDSDERKLADLIAKAKAKREKEGEPKKEPKAKAKAKVVPTLPLYEGQRVIARNGQTGVVSGDRLKDEENPTVRVSWDKDGSWWHRESDGKFDRTNLKAKNEFDIISDAPAE